MPDVTDNDAAQARQELVGFLTDLRDLLDGVLRERPEWFGHGHARLLDVWDEEVKQLIETVIAELGRTDAESADVDASLRAHGLMGRQLDVKLTQFRSALEALLDEIDNVDEAERYWRTWLSRLSGSRAAKYVRSRLERLRNTGRRAIRSKFGRVLRIANHILESLGDAIKFVPGAGAAIAATKEFKESLEVAVEEPDELARPGSPASSLKRLRRRGTPD